MALAAAALVRAASSDASEVAGVVRVSASEVIAVEILPPMLARLQAVHPTLAIELSPSNRNEDVLRREADIAVRMVTPVQTALIAQRVGVVRLGLHAHRDYLARRSMPETLEAMRGHALIGVERDSPVLRALQSGGLPMAIEDCTFRSDSDLAQLAAIRAGAGIGICQSALAARDPALVPVLAGAFGFDLETWVVCHEDLRNVARVRAVFDALVDGLSDYTGQRANGGADEKSVQAASESSA